MRLRPLRSELPLCLTGRGCQCQWGMHGHLTRKWGQAGQVCTRPRNPRCPGIGVYSPDPGQIGPFNRDSPISRNPGRIGSGRKSRICSRYRPIGIGRIPAISRPNRGGAGRGFRGLVCTSMSQLVTGSGRRCVVCVYFTSGGRSAWVARHCASGQISGPPVQSWGGASLSGSALRVYREVLRSCPDKRGPMGILTVATPMHWDKAKPYLKLVRREGIEQFMHTYVRRIQCRASPKHTGPHSTAVPT